MVGCTGALFARRRKASCRRGRGGETPIASEKPVLMIVSRQPPPVLFVVPDLSRSGAPAVALSFMRWLTSRGETGFELLVGGPRAAQDTAPGMARYDEAAALGPVHMLTASSPRLPENDAALRAGRYGLVHAFSAVALEPLARFERGGAPLVCHALEQQFTIASALGRRFPELVRAVDHFVACGRAVGDAVARFAERPPDSVAVIPNAVDVDAVIAQAARRDRAALRATLGAAPDATVVVGCGRLSWTKGTHLIVPLAQALRRSSLSNRFCLAWVASNPGGVEHATLLHEIERAELTPWVRVVVTDGPPAAVFGGADIFALLSLEDACPLVMLEAAASGLPVVGFAGSGGVVEFVDGATELLAPYGDVEEMARRIAALATDETRRTATGAACLRRVRERHDEAVVFGALAERIEAWRRR